MSSAASQEVLRHLNTLFHCGAAGQLNDSELLERFVAGQGEDAEAAFAALVERHGAMVLGVCRRVLGKADAAEDAFQATFLVLARKAAAIARREQLASWLHGVARRAALDARARATRRKAMEKRLGAMLSVEPPNQIIAGELRAVLDEELATLPERHRAAIVLCELEGLSRREAASRLGISQGTLSSRLARAKGRLRDRLTRRGFALSTATLASLLTHDAHALVVPPSLVDSTIRAASLVAAGSSMAGVVSTSVATITQGVLKAMLLAKLKFAVLGLISLTVITAGMGVMAQDGPKRPTDNDRLQSVERKLDRLLEVMGGARRPMTLPVGQPPVTAAAPRAATPPALATPAGPALAVVPPAPLGSPAADPAKAPQSPGGPPGHWVLRGDLAGRVDLLERRLADLERRFSDLERRVNTGHARPATAPAPPPPPSAFGDLQPLPPAVAGSPLEQAPGSGPRRGLGLPQPVPSLPSADVAAPAADGAPALAPPGTDNVPAPISAVPPPPADLTSP